MTPTHFTVLGLLATRDWSTYDLIGYMQNSHLRWFWSKTESRLYQTPKELVAGGHATSYKERISDRPDAKGRERTIYAITDQGRDALGQWLKEPSQPPSFEIEALVKLALADQGTLQGLQRHIEDIRHDLTSQGRLTTVRNASASPQVPERVHLSSHMAGLLVRIVHTTLEWLAELEDDVRSWDTVESTPEHIEQGQARYHHLAEWMSTTTLPGTSKQEDSPT